MARKRSKAAVNKPAGAPAYIVSMSSLWTILLSFFIMMVTMGSEQECGFIAAGTGSFLQDMQAAGMPGVLDGTRNAFVFGRKIPTYGASEEDVEAARNNEGAGDMRVLKAPDKRLEGVKDLPPRSYLWRMPVRACFEPGSDELDWRARRELDSLLKQIRNSRQNITIEAYVDPVSSFPTPPADTQAGWLLSSRRAQAVARYFHERGGIPHSRLVPVGYNYHRPVTDAARTNPANARVVVVIYDD